MRRWFSDGLMAVVLPCGGVAVALLAIEIMKPAGLLPLSIPAPSDVWTAFQRNPAGVLRSVRATAVSSLLGYAMAVMIALLAASAAALAANLRQSIYNLSVILSSVPLIAATPLLA